MFFWVDFGGHAGQRVLAPSLVIAASEREEEEGEEERKRVWEGVLKRGKLVDLSIRDRHWHPGLK